MLTLPRDAFRDVSAYQGQQQHERVRGSHERTGPAHTVFCHTYFPCSLALRFYQVASVFCSGSESGVRGWYRGGWASFESSDRLLGPFCLLVCVIVLSPVVSRSFQFCVVGLSAFTGSFANRLLRKLVVNLSLCEKGVSNVVRELKPAPSPAGNSKWSSFYKDLYTGPFGVHRLNPWQG
ncbi:unnamed protein product [Sphagnum jensenii]|uniref:Uncharacterized protein n=1 Tax=Sphagnum jensenii TaxID=128206 RepID=A0ABP0WEY7_9BRYO